MLGRDRHAISRSCGRGLWLLVLLLVTRSASAQNPASPESTPAPPAGGLTFQAAGDELSGRWVPLGPVPVDQAGAGRRGYVLPGEDSEVTAAGSNQFSIHAVAANNFFREQNSEFLVSQRYETHTIGLDYRRGFKVRGFPRFEIGGQVQLHESDIGVLNGFILGVESFWVSVTGDEQPRTQDAARPPLGTLIVRNGSTI